jgi:hypothetical protein
MDSLASASSSFKHGCNDCRACFGDRKPIWHSPDRKPYEVKNHRWLLRANPAYWGSAEPEILVLGFSKGSEQNKLIDRHLSARSRVRFEDIPFNDDRRRMRSNLRKLLMAMGLLSQEASVDALFTPTETAFGFASLIRCSVEYAKPNSDVYAMQGSQITKNTLKRRPGFVEACITRHLSELPDSIKLVVVLGATTDYVADVMEIMRGVPEFPDEACSYAYRVGETPVVHVPHPSGGNSGSVAVFAGERPPSTKSDSETNIPECRRQVDAMLASIK